MEIYRRDISQGARIVLRDVEWLVKRADPTSSKGQKLSCIGLSEIVQDREMLFLTEYEGKIEILDPSKTLLKPDYSSRYIESRLYIESAIRQMPPHSQAIAVGDRAAADTWPFQLEPAAKALSKPRQRILIADGVGMGKTIEAGVLLSECIRRGRGKRILAVTSKSMLTQFQRELWSRFTIPLVRLDSIGLGRVKAKIPNNQNPFYYYDKSIISIDTLKQDNAFRNHLENAYWDIILVDEAHNVAMRGSKKSDRHRLAKLLAKRSDTLIMLTATPHDGKQESFASLIKMLDPSAVVEEGEVKREEIDGLFIRRLKKDLPSGMFKEKKTFSLKAEASEAEERLFKRLAEVQFDKLDRERSGHYLFKTLLRKSVFSSPAACKKLIENRLSKLAKQENASPRDIAALKELHALVDAIGPEQFSKYQRFLEECRNRNSPNYWDGSSSNDRLVIFTESRETLAFLERELPRDLGLGAKQLLVMHGSLSDVEQQAVVEAFGSEKSAARLLLATDVASEGINLHYLSHRLVHFDLPWSIMVYQQRSGRIDRYGQEENPLIAYLETHSAEKSIGGDLEILSKLKEKDEQIHKNIGDPLTLENIYCEKYIVNAIEQGGSSGDSSSPLNWEEEEFDFFADLMEEASAPVEVDKERMPSLFKDDFTFLKNGLEQLYSGKEPCYEICEEKRKITLNPLPPELVHRFKYYPSEIAPENNSLALTSDKELIASSCRKGGWPELHYLWELHPVLFWIRDRLTLQFGRHAAPIITLPLQLESGEAHFLLSGLFPNKKGHPLIERLFSVRALGGEISGEVLLLQELLEKIDLKEREYPNDSERADSEELQRLLPLAIERGRSWMAEERERFYAKNRPLLGSELSHLKSIYERQRCAVERRYDERAGIAEIQRKKCAERLREVEENYREKKQWIEETIETDKEPHFQVLGVITGGK